MVLTNHENSCWSHGTNNYNNHHDDPIQRRSMKNDLFNIDNVVLTQPPPPPPPIVSHLSSNGYYGFAPIQNNVPNMYQSINDHLLGEACLSKLHEIEVMLNSHAIPFPSNNFNHCDKRKRTSNNINGYDHYAMMEGGSTKKLKTEYEEDIQMDDHDSYGQEKVQNQTLQQSHQPNIEPLNDLRNNRKHVVLDDNLIDNKTKFNITPTTANNSLENTEIISSKTKFIEIDDFKSDNLVQNVDDNLLLERLLWHTHGAGFPQQQ